MRLGVLGVEIDGGSIERLGVRGAILPRSRVAQVVVSLGVAAVELDRLLVATSRFVVPLQALENLSEIIPAHRRVGPQSHGPLNERESRFQVPGLQRNDAEQMQG